MKHEGFDFTKNIYNSELPVNNSDDPWSANIAVPNLIFDDFEKFNQHLNVNFELIYRQNSEFLIFLNSGGVIAKTFYIPLNHFFLNLVKNFDYFLSKFQKIFPMQMSIVIKKN